MTRFIFGIILIAIGIGAITGFSFINFVFALILILLGIRMLAGHGWGNWNWENKFGSVSGEDFINEVVIFGPLKKTVKSENFKGGKIVAVFGAFNSRVAAGEGGVTLNIKGAAIFGEVEIIN